MEKQTPAAMGYLHDSLLIYGWNQVAPFSCQFERPALIELNDETLRDGLQCPSVLQPSLEQKQAFLRLLPRLGINSADIGYAGASKNALEDVVALAKQIVEEKLSIQPNCAGRTHEADIRPIAEAAQRSGLDIEAALFIGSSPIRQIVEGWDLSHLQKMIEKAISFAREQGLSVMFVTEDTTRAQPADLAALYLTAARAGAARLCLADTVGYATPTGVQRLIEFLRGQLQQAGFEHLTLDWHGHRDRGLDIANSLAALSAGVTRVHGTALGIGERVGNTALDTLLTNLVLMDWYEQDLSALDAYCRLASEMLGSPIPRNYPIMGEDAFTTSTGVHAAAILKAQAMGNTLLADGVYSAVPAGMVGRRQTITVGPMSGQANAVAWLRDHGIASSPERIAAILTVAKHAHSVLTDVEIMAAIQAIENLKRARGDDPMTAATRSAAQLLLGNEAIALGALHAGVRVATGYPGTPSTETLEYLARIAPEEISVEWSTNEKVALDVGIGAALSGARSLVTMKHVGLNVAMDSWMTSAFIGVNGGLVVLSADDPGMHSSQNEQDNRYLAAVAGIPFFEPADSQEAYDFTRAAFYTSETWDLPCLVRTTTRISHSRSRVIASEPEEVIQRSFRRQPEKYVMLPVNARKRRAEQVKRLARLEAWVDTHPFNREEQRSTSVGIITGGISYHYVREALPEASILKLGIGFPLPARKICEFASKVERLYVVEELEPYIEDEVRRLGIAVEGKQWFSRIGELSQETIRKGFQQAGELPKPHAQRNPPGMLPTPVTRPPVLCAGCPHATPYLVLREMDAFVMGDIGCYTLAAGEPLKAMDSCLAMGSSIGMAIGMAKAGEHTHPIVATIGDSTFLHGGIPALLDAVYSKVDITVVILDNGITAMTGGQPHPASGSYMRGKAAPRANIPDLCRAIGVDSVVIVDPYDLGATNRALLAATRSRGVSVIITNRPCVEAPVKSRGRVYAVAADRCDGCQLCMNLGCPAIVWDIASEERRVVRIDADLCSGCTVCAQICPQSAIHAEVQL